MKTALRRSLVLGAVALLAAPPALAQGPASEVPAATLAGMSSVLAPGATLIVTDTQGRTTTGRLTALSTESLSIEASGRLATFAAGDLQEVRHRRPDSVLNGGFIGFAAGFGVPAIACAASGSDEAGVCTGIAFIVGGLPGFLIGMGVDALMAKKVTVFRAARGSASQFRLSPIVGPRQIGVSASIPIGSAPGR